MQRIVTLRQAALPASDPRIAAAESQLAAVYSFQARKSGNAEKFKLSELLRRSAISRAEQSLGPLNLTVTGYRVSLAWVLYFQHRPKEALSEVCTALRIAHGLVGPDDMVLFGSLGVMARIMSALGDPEGAAELHEASRRVIDRDVGMDDPAGRALEKFCATAPVS